MSWKATAQVKTLRENLTRSEKLLLLILADYHNEKTGRCDPSYQHIADDSLTSRRQVIRLLQSLERKGFLIMHHRPNDSNQFDLLCIDDTMSLVTNVSENVTPLVTKSTPASDIAMSPKPSLNRKGTVRTVKNNKDNGITLSVEALAKEAFKKRKWFLDYYHEQLLTGVCDKVEAICGPVDAPDWIDAGVELSYAGDHPWSLFWKVMETAIQDKRKPERREYGRATESNPRAVTTLRQTGRPANNYAGFNEIARKQKEQREREGLLREADVGDADGAVPL